MPVITTIDADSPAEHSGLRPGDLILEINGKPTNGQSNKKISDWIRNSGNAIEFLVRREKTSDTSITDDLAREVARKIADEVAENTRNPESEVEVNIPSRLSRKESAQLSKRSNELSQCKKHRNKMKIKLE